MKDGEVKSSEDRRESAHAIPLLSDGLLDQQVSPQSIPKPDMPPKGEGQELVREVSNDMPKLYRYDW